MIPYILIFLFNIFFINIDFYSKNKNKKFLFLFLVNTLFVGLRAMIGGFDVYIYSEIYEASNYLVLTYEPFEIGFRFFLVFLKLFSNDRHFLLFVVALITFYIHYRYLNKYSPLFYFSAFIFFCKFFLMSFVYLRQELAMCVLIASIPFIIKRNLFIYSLFLIAAFFIHKSSIIFLPAYFIYNFYFKKETIILIGLLIVIIAVTPLNNFLLSSLIEQFQDDKVEIYFNKSNGFNFFYLIETLIFIVLLIKYKNSFDRIAHGRFFYNGFLLYILITLLAVNNATFIRFSWYFLFFMFVGLAYIYTFITSINSRKIYMFFFLLYFSALFFRLLILYDGGDFMPYKMFFQDFDRNGMWDFMEYR